MSNDELRTALAIEMPKLMVENAALREELRDVRAANESLRKRIAELERIPSRIRDWYYGRNKTVNADSLVDIVAASDALLASSQATPEGGGG